MFQRRLDVVAVAAIVARIRDAEHRFSEVRGKIENSRAQCLFGNKTAGRVAAKLGSGRQISDYPLTSGWRFAEVCGKFRNLRAYRPFRAKKPQVEALSLRRVLGIFDICRILPVLAPCFSLLRCCKPLIDYI